jgi:hypothetical protein
MLLLTADCPHVVEQTIRLMAPRSRSRGFYLCLVILCVAHPARAQSTDSLVGAWRASVRFADGPFASLANLEFLYVFNAGGTMTESSNYDGAPPAPPAYGIWRRVGDRVYEAKYLFWMTQPPSKLDDVTSGGGWMPAGHGEFTERITLATDGRTFTSTMRYEQFDIDGKPNATATAEVRGRRVGFE